MVTTWNWPKKSGGCRSELGALAEDGSMLARSPRPLMSTLGARGSDNR